MTVGMGVRSLLRSFLKSKSTSLVPLHPASSSDSSRCCVCRWIGCNKAWTRPAAFDTDVGTPLGPLLLLHMRVIFVRSFHATTRRHADASRHQNTLYFLSRPTGFCTETAPNSGVFTREWSKATVSLDCGTFTASIVPK